MARHDPLLRGVPPKKCACCGKKFNPTQQRRPVVPRLFRRSNQGTQRQLAMTVNGLMEQVTIHTTLWPAFVDAQANIVHKRAPVPDGPEPAK